MFDLVIKSWQFSIVFYHSVLLPAEYGNVSYFTFLTTLGTVRLILALLLDLYYLTVGLVCIFLMLMSTFSNVLVGHFVYLLQKSLSFIHF